jgi:hypothetical protein
MTGRVQIPLGIRTRVVAEHSFGAVVRPHERQTPLSETHLAPSGQGGRVERVPHRSCRGSKRAASGEHATEAARAVRRLRAQSVVDSFRGPVFEDLRLTVLLRQLFERLHDRIPTTEERRQRAAFGQERTDFAPDRFAIQGLDAVEERPIDSLHDLLDVEVDLGRISEAARAIDEDEVPGRIEEPVPGVGIDVARQGVKHLRPVQLTIPARGIGIANTLFLDVTEHARVLGPQLQGRRCVLVSNLDGGRDHVQFEKAVHLVGSDFGLVAFEAPIAPAGRDPPDGRALGQTTRS